MNLFIIVKETKTLLISSEKSFFIEEWFPDGVLPVSLLAKERNYVQPSMCEISNTCARKRNLLKQLVQK